jgi:hypothetical protein
VLNKIQHANDGSDHAFKYRLPSRTQPELHIVSVEEIPYLPI